MKRSPQLRDLSDDHHEALVLARRCKRARAEEVAAEAAWQQVLGAFSARLAPHFAIEERHLLPALEAAGEGTLAQQIRRKHAVLRSLVAQRSGLLARVAEFGAPLESHVRFEERRVFPVAEARLQTSDLEAIAAACREARGGARLPPLA